MWISALLWNLFSRENFARTFLSFWNCFFVNLGWIEKLGKKKCRQFRKILHLKTLEVSCFKWKHIQPIIFFLHGERNKVAIVTGGSSGLGKEISLQLAESGAKVYVTHLKGEEKMVYEHSNIHKLEMDLREWDSVRRTCRAFSSMEKQLDILVSNAGIVRSRLVMTKHNIEETFAVNFVGPVVLVTTLQDLGLLPKTTEVETNANEINLDEERNLPRIIFVASDMHKQAGVVDFKMITWQNPNYGLKQALDYYAASKNLLVSFATELARRMQGFDC